jgi:hypothetical protein
VQFIALFSLSFFFSCAPLASSRKRKAYYHKGSGLHVMRKRETRKKLVLREKAEAWEVCEFPYKYVPNFPSYLSLLQSTLLLHNSSSTTTTSKDHPPSFTLFLTSARFFPDGHKY